MASRGELSAAVLQGTGERAEGAGGVGTARRVQGAAHLGERTKAKRSSTAELAAADVGGGFSKGGGARDSASWRLGF